MRELTNKVFTSLLSFMLVPAISCVCCEVSHAESSKDHCCHDEVETHGASSDSGSSCYGDCLLQGISRETNALLTSSKTKNESLLLQSGDSSDGNKFLALSVTIPTELEILAGYFHFSDFKISSGNPVKSSPQQGRSPPLTVL